MTLPKNVLFLVENNRSPSIEEQRSACQDDGALVVDAGAISFQDMDKALVRAGDGLEAGDTITVYDFNCLALNTTTLIRVLAKVLKKGVTVRFHAQDITIRPDEQDEPFKLIAALDNHWRLVHGIKTHANDSKPGRKARLADDQLDEIRTMLGAQGATVTSVAKELGVGRTTLFDFLQRLRQDEKS
ncbi:Site-specific DNA recombinase [Sphingobium faniae]|nr:Site-specific DNA recombinase [Sphingobium faniae]